MSAWEYWSKAEALMAENQDLEPDDIAQELADAGYILPADRGTVAKEISAHNAVYGREDDDSDCKCGKWLEHNYFEWPDHLGEVLDQWITEPGKADR